MRPKIKIDLANINYAKFEIERTLKFGNFYWKTKDGVTYHISNMSDSHILNAIHHIDERLSSFFSMNEEPNLKLPAWSNIFQNLVVEAVRRKLIRKELKVDLKFYELQF